MAPNQFQVEAINWSHARLESPILEFDESRVHVMLISLGSLLPSESNQYLAHQAWQSLRRWLFIAIDGKPVFNTWQEFWPALPGQIDAGLGLFSAGTSEVCFAGKLLSVTPVAPDLVIAQIRLGIIHENTR